MALGIKYKVEYSDIAGIDTTINIKEEGYTGSPISLVGTGEPFVISMDSSEDKFTPVRGTGATLEVYSEDNFQLRNLYTEDIFKYPVEAIKNGSVFWNGYINTEVYSEDYSKSENYPVTLELNDGLALLDRIKFLDANGDKFTGLITLWELFQRIMGEIGLDHKYYFVSLDKVPENTIKATSETPLHLIRVNQANYYDEEGDPMTYREVLEAILLPFGATLLKHDGAVHLLDVDKLAEDSFIRNRYSNTFIYEGVDTVDVNIDISSNATKTRFVNADQKLDIVGGYSKQSISYSPYSELTLFNKIDLDNEENRIGTPEYTFYNTDVDYYRITGFTNLNYKLENGATIATHCDKIHDSSSTPRPDDDGTENYYILIEGANTGEKIVSTTPSIVNINKHDTSTIEISIDFFIETNNSPLKTEDKDEFNILKYKCYVKLGDKYLTTVRDGNWKLITSLTNTPTKMTFGHRVNSTETINDKWVTAKFRLPRWSDNSNAATLIDYGHTPIEIQITNDFEIWKVSDNKTSKKTNVRIKNIEAVLVNGVRTEIDNTGRFITTYSDATDDDIEYTGSINEKFANEGSEISLIHGDSDTNNCTDKGAFYTYQNTFTSKWVKGTESNTHPISSLLLRSVISNYKSSLTELNGTLDSSLLMASSDNKTPSCLGFLSTISDTTYLGSKRLMCVGGKYNDANREFSGNWLEVLKDSEANTINTTS